MEDIRAKREGRFGFWLRGRISFEVFVCLFVCLLVCLFVTSHSREGSPLRRERCTSNPRGWADLAEERTMMYSLSGRGEEQEREKGRG
jgi:hypothetical protein